MHPPLFIGRFQPFHMGHLSVIINVLQKYDHIIIGIGSSQEKNTSRNPFSYTQRKTIIQKVLEEENISQNQYSIIAIPDIHNAPLWVDHVVKLCPPFSCVYTGSLEVSTLFQKKNIPVFPVTFSVDICATDIRKSLAQKTNHWKNFVHKSAIEYIVEYHKNHSQTD